jgi:small subunit ribosomal protein S6
MPEVQALKSKEYETIYVLRSDVDADTAEKVQARVSEVVSRDNGKLVKVEAWGRRKLAYPVAKQKKGVYVYVKFVGRGGVVAELERNLKLQDAVLKFQTVLTQEDVDVSAVTVDPEEVKFERLELPAEDDKEESRERQLGLIEMEPPKSMRGEPREEDFVADRAAADAGAREGAEAAPAAKEGETAKEAGEPAAKEAEPAAKEGGEDKA